MNGMIIWLGRVVEGLRVAELEGKIAGTCLLYLNDIYAHTALCAAKKGLLMCLNILCDQNTANLSVLL